MRAVLVATTVLLGIAPAFAQVYGSRNSNSYRSNGPLGIGSNPNNYYVVSTRTAQEIAQNACATAAFNEYNKSNLGLLLQQGTAPLMSVETIIAKRRLQEQFCSRFARCLVGDPNNLSLALPYSAAFSSCLRDEVLEQYDAVPRASE